jgi:integrase
MTQKTALPPLQNVTRKNSGDLVRVPAERGNSLRWWVEQYFAFEVTTAASSQQVQRRDLEHFMSFVEMETGGDSLRAWSPRVSKAFVDALRNELNEGGRRRNSDRTINRKLAHLKTFAKWVHKLFPFPLGEPTQKIKGLAVGNSLDIERALSVQERRKMLDAADLLLRIGGESKDRSRHRGGERPKRKGFRAYRNRAVIYVLIETGMRRAAITNLDIDDIDAQRKSLSTREKGASSHRYQISKEGLEAINDYITHERKDDDVKWQSPALFLTAATVGKGSGRLTVRMINLIWDSVAELAGVAGRTPHSARHAMGRHLIEKTGNIAAVQRQLGHKNAAYSMQYSRITDNELNQVLDER